MPDKEFLTWLRARLINVHGESHYVDYMCKLTSIINAMDPSNVTPNTACELTNA